MAEPPDNHHALGTLPSSKELYDAIYNLVPSGGQGAVEWRSLVFFSTLSETTGLGGPVLSELARTGQ